MTEKMTTREAAQSAMRCLYLEVGTEVADDVAAKVEAAFDEDRARLAEHEGILLAIDMVAQPRAGEGRVHAVERIVKERDEDRATIAALREANREQAARLDFLKRTVLASFPAHAPMLAPGGGNEPVVVPKTPLPDFCDAIAARDATIAGLREALEAAANYMSSDGMYDKAQYDAFDEAVALVNAALTPTTPAAPEDPHGR